MTNDNKLLIRGSPVYLSSDCRQPPETSISCAALLNKLAFLVLTCGFSNKLNSGHPFYEIKL